MCKRHGSPLRAIWAVEDLGECPAIGIRHMQGLRRSPCAQCAVALDQCQAVRNEAKTEGMGRTTLPSLLCLVLSFTIDPCGGRKWEATPCRLVGLVWMLREGGQAMALDQAALDRTAGRSCGSFKLPRIFQSQPASVFILTLSVPPASGSFEGHRVNPIVLKTMHSLIFLGVRAPARGALLPSASRMPAFSA